MSVAAKRSGRPELPRQWERLERLAEEAAVAVAFWRRRALEAEDEVLRLRQALEELAAVRATDRPEVASQPEEVREELLRLRAENASLHSRMLQARRRVGALMKRLASLDVEP